MGHSGGLPRTPSVLGSDSPQTPFDSGTARERVRCAQRKKSFMPNGVPPMKALDLTPEIEQEKTRIVEGVHTRWF